MLQGGKANPHFSNLVYHLPAINGNDRRGETACADDKFRTCSAFGGIGSSGLVEQDELIWAALKQGRCAIHPGEC